MNEDWKTLDSKSTIRKGSSKTDCMVLWANQIAFSVKPIREWVWELKPYSSFQLVGNNWLASSSDVFNNWVFGCKSGLEQLLRTSLISVEKASVKPWLKRLKYCSDGFQTITSTEFDSFDLPSKMSNVSNAMFRKNSKAKFQNWSFPHFRRYFRFLRSIKTNGFRGMRTVVLSGSTDTLIWQIITSLFWTKIVIFQQFPIASRNGNSRNHEFLSKPAGPARTSFYH